MRQAHGPFVLLIGLTFIVLPLTASGQSRNAEHYLFLAQKRAKVSSGSLVAGNMAVNDPGGRLNLSKGSRLADGTQVVADQVDVRAGSRAFDVFANSGQLAGSIDGTLTEPIPPPLYSPEALVAPTPFDQANFPPAFPISCGGPGRAGAEKEAFSLPPGTYDAVSVGRGGKVVLSSGTYNFCSLRAIKSGGIEITAPATINIRDQIRVGTSSSVTPFGNPSDIQFNVMGNVVRLGPSSTFNARVFAPGATLRLGREALLTGHFVSRAIAADKGIRVFTCGNGMLDAGEQCDVTAPNGDAACPGQCGIPGSPNECTCPTPSSTTTTSSTSTTASSTTSSSTSSTTATTSPETMPPTTTTSTTEEATTTTEATTTSTTAAPTTTTTTGASTTTTTLPVPCVPQPTEIDSNFNGTPIRKNDFIWFNSVLNVDGLPSSQPVTIRFDNSAIDFTAAGNPYHLVVPNAEITFSPTATLATTTFNTATNTWETTVPSTGLAGNDWLTGLAFQAPVDLPGGINPVSWSGTFSSDTPGLTIHWQWAAAVYTTFSTDYNSLGVKPVDDNNASIYMNSDHAGTPENFKAFVIGGARGGGGSNFTGSLSGTGTVTCP